ncbi:MAG TPA: PspC domain-containing protein [Solirubrobacteraceae bacterium]|jgi:signal transduction histidine kinase|nr:PspC domain-containing protein [Solirubrobacteraceae bacterium]
MASAQQADGPDARGEPAADMASTAPQAAVEGGWRGARLYRYPDRGLLGGVGAGISEHLGINVLGVRVVMVLLIVAGGVGAVLYVLAWALIPVAPESAGVPRPRGAWRVAAQIVLVMVIVVWALRRAGLLLEDSVMWPIVLATAGLALVWRPSLSLPDQLTGRHGRFSPQRLLPRHVDAPRLIIGVLLVAFACASALHSAGVFANLGKALGAVAFVATILGVLFAPSVVRQGRSLASERAARIREQERADVAAHLHDSVLQTLALIQKRAADPREVAGLARRQERELRSWLFERHEGASEDSFKVGLERAVADVETLHRVPVEAIIVGDAQLDARLEALVLAAREAMTNAAKFAGVEHVDLYAEIDETHAELFVRDRGVGFDQALIPPDRRGVRDSILGRMARHGGRAMIRSGPGEGTEVELSLERGRGERTQQFAMSPVSQP